MGKFIFIMICLFLFIASACADEGAGKFVYEAHGKRDPFIPLIGDIQTGHTESREIMNIEDVIFQGIASDAKGKKVVIINDEMFRVGGTAGAMVVKKISDKSVIIIIQGKEYDLLLYGEENARRE